MSAVGHCDIAAGLDILHGQLFYPFGTVVVTGGWQHEGAFPFGMEYSVTMDGGTVEYNPRVVRRRSSRRPSRHYRWKRATGMPPSSNTSWSAAAPGFSPSDVLRGNRRSQWS